MDSYLDIICEALLYLDRSTMVRCGHPFGDHIFHGVEMVECWRCEDWHTFVMEWE